jgi:hypothetical protein
MHKNATKCNETLSKWCKNKHGASKIIDTFETYHISYHIIYACDVYPFMHLILLRFDHAVALYDDPLHINIKIKMCSSIACTVKKVHRFETPCDDRV